MSDKSETNNEENNEEKDDNKSDSKSSGENWGWASDRNPSSDLTWSENSD